MCFLFGKLNILINMLVSQAMQDIYFYGHVVGQYKCFSNFYPCSFVDVNGLRFNCSEQYFMYKKCLLFEPNNIDAQQRILNETNPTTIKSLGRRVKNYHENIWRSYRFAIMKQALYLKFSQNPELKDILLNTLSARIYEASKWDKIWGIGYSIYEVPYVDKKTFGTNLLGEALMDIRNTLFREES